MLMEKRVEVGVGRKGSYRCDGCSSRKVREDCVLCSPISHPGAIISLAYSGGHFQTLDIGYGVAVVQSLLHIHIGLYRRYR